MPKLREVVFVESPWRRLEESEAHAIQAVTAHVISGLNHVTDWRLQKAYYLAEVWSIEERLQRLSRAEFASWTHGPWSLHVRESVEALAAAGALSREARRARRRAEADFFTLRRAPAELPLPSADIEFLQDVTDQIRYLGGETLTRIAKATRPYGSTEPRKLIDLDGYLGSLKRKHAKFAMSSKVAALVAQAVG